MKTETGSRLYSQHLREHLTDRLYSAICWKEVYAGSVPSDGDTMVMRLTCSLPFWSLYFTRERLTRIKRANKFIITNPDKCYEGNRVLLRIQGLGTSLVVQWLRLLLPLQWVWVRSLVRELRSCMPHGVAKKKKKKKKNSGSNIRLHQTRILVLDPELRLGWGKQGTCLRHKISEAPKKLSDWDTYYFF